MRGVNTTLPSFYLDIVAATATTIENDENL